MLASPGKKLRSGERLQIDHTGLRGNGHIHQYITVGSVKEDGI